MPNFGPDLEPDEIKRVADFVLQRAKFQKNRKIIISIADLAQHFSRAVTERSHVTNRIRWKMQAQLQESGISPRLLGPAGYEFTIDESIAIDEPVAVQIKNHASKKSVDTFTKFKFPFIPPSYFSTLVDILQTGDRPLLVGPKGCGKSRALEEAFARVGTSAIRIALGEINDPTKLIGTKEIVNQDGVPVTRLVGGLIREAAMNGTAVILDELDSVSPNTALALNRIMEQESKLVLDTEHGTEIITPQPGFGIAATANTWGYGDGSGDYVGTFSQNRATWDRLHPKFECGYDHKIEKQLVAPLLPPAVLKTMYNESQTLASDDGIVIQIRRAIADKNAPLDDTLGMRTILYFAERYTLLGWHKSMYFFVNEFKPEFRETIAKIVTDKLGLEFAPSMNDYDPVLPTFIPNLRAKLSDQGFI